MPNYSKGAIYTIRCLNDPNIYVGSTIQPLSVRMGQHRKDYAKNKILGKNKEIVKDIKDWKIELHELYPCLSRKELCRREGQIIREIGTLNKSIAGRTKQEYYIDNIDKCKEKNKKFRTNNKDYNKEYNNKNKERKKQWYIKHKLLKSLKNNEIKITITE